MKGESKMTTFYLLRHGETEWNHDHNRYCGRTDIALSAEGERQADLAGLQLSRIPFDAIYSSPLKRALETTRRVNAHHSKEVIADPRLMEADFGQWEGKTKAEIMQLYPESWESWMSDPANTRAGDNGETALEVYNRAHRAFHEIAREHRGKNVLVTAHNTFNRLFMAGALGLPFHKYRTLTQHNTGISIFEINQEDDFLLIQFNSIMHLI